MPRKFQKWGGGSEAFGKNSYLSNIFKCEVLPKLGKRYASLFVLLRVNFFSPCTLQYSSHSLEAWGHQDPREGGEYAHFPMKHSPVNPQTRQSAENSCSSHWFWKFYGRICGWVWNINTQARISLFRVQGRSPHSFYSQGKLLQCLGLSQTSAVIHPVQLAHDPAPGVPRPGVESLGV